MNWKTYLMNMAHEAATKSKDTTKVGAVLADRHNAIRGTAFNGPPLGVIDLPERFERPAKYLFASHAEANLIAFAARTGTPTAGCAVYVTHMPCAACARTLIQAGIKRVHFGPGKTAMADNEFEAARVMFGEAGVICEAV